MKTGVVSDSELLEREMATSKQYKAHVMLLRRAMMALQDSDGPSNNELDGFIADFIDKQAASQDKCPSQLMDAKHDLKQLHVEVHDLVAQVKATEIQILTTTSQLTQAKGNTDAAGQRQEVDVVACEKRKDV